MSLKVKLDRDWVALNAYRMALEHIIDAGEDSFGGDGAAEIAKRVLEQFPTSDRVEGGAT